MNKKNLIIGSSVLGGVLIGTTVGVLKYLEGKKKKEEITEPIFKAIKRTPIQNIDSDIKIISTIQEKKKNIQFYFDYVNHILFGEYFGSNNNIVDLTNKQYFVIMSDENKVYDLKRFVKTQTDIGRLNVVFVGQNKERTFKLMPRIKKIDLKEIYFYDSDFLLIDRK